MKLIIRYVTTLLIAVLTAAATVLAETVTISLKEGWNLISVPINPSNTLISSVFSSISGKYGAVYAYNGIEYEAYIPGASSNSLTRIEASRGYWVYMNEAANVAIDGSVAPRSINLNVGWNMVGFNSTNTLGIPAALGVVSSKVSAIYAYVAGANRYIAYFGEGAGELTRFQPGEGYWIYAKESATWTLPNNQGPPLTKVELGPANFNININGYVPFYRHKRDGRDCLGIEPAKYQDKPAAAQATFAGSDGTYKVTITMYKEADGESYYSVLVNGEKRFEYSYPSLTSKAEEKYEPYTWPTSIQLKKGDTILVVVKAHSNKKIKESGSPGGFAWSRGRWSSLSFEPVQ
jgi:hypothetical protein